MLNINHILAHLKRTESLSFISIWSKNVHENVHFFKKMSTQKKTILGLVIFVDVDITIKKKRFNIRNHPNNKIENFRIAWAQEELGMQFHIKLWLE